MNASRERLDSIVIRSLDYGEADRVIGLFTRERGKVSLFARGARRSRKRFGGGLDLFSHVVSEVRMPTGGRGGMATLQEIQLVDPHLPLRENLEKLALAGYLAEVLWGFAGEGDAQPHLFRWWKETLGRLCEADSVTHLLPRLDLELLALCGYAPRWKVCTECGSPPLGKTMFFSFSRGGVSCERCHVEGDGAWLSLHLVEALAAKQDLSPEHRLIVCRIVDAFVRYTLGRAPKSQQFRKEIFYEGC